MGRGRSRRGLRVAVARLHRQRDGAENDRTADEAVSVGRDQPCQPSQNLQKGEIVRADRSWEDEKDMIETDGGDISPIIGTRNL